MRGQRRATCRRLPRRRSWPSTRAGRHGRLCSHSSKPTRRSTHHTGAIVSAAVHLISLCRSAHKCDHDHHLAQSSSESLPSPTLSLPPKIIRPAAPRRAPPGVPSTRSLASTSSGTPLAVRAQRRSTDRQARAVGAGPLHQGGCAARQEEAARLAGAARPIGRRLEQWRFPSHTPFPNYG
jgi:hypothetical protein